MKRYLFSFLFVLLVALFGCLFVSCSSQQHTHSFGEWTIASEATCTESGLKEHTCECGEKETEIIPATGHIWGNETLLQSATCQTSGVKQYTCSVCKQTKTETIAKLSHSFDAGVVTVEPTCSATGSKLFTCSECGYTKTERVAKLPHNYDEGQTTHEPTCTTIGIKTYTCYDCGQTKTEQIAMLGHKPNENYICERCGELCHISLDMNETQQQASLKVRRLAERSIEHDSANSRFVLHFTFYDSNYHEIAAPAAVEIKIVNDDDLVVYSAVKIVTMNDFSIWTKNDKRYLLATIYIDDEEITQGLNDDGRIYFTIYNDNYFSFEETSLTIWSSLPLLPVTITLPTIPQIINYYNYSGTLDSSCTITDITCGFSGFNGSLFYIYFTGEKTYDKEGKNHNGYCRIGYKIYDSEGYIIESGYVLTDQMTVGEKFKNVKLYFGEAERGQTYRLELLNVT